MEGFVQRVEEVAGDDKDEDASSVCHELGSLRLRPWVAGANGDAVVDALDDGGCVLSVSLSTFPQRDLGRLTFGRTAHPRKGRREDMAISP